MSKKEIGKRCRGLEEKRAQERSNVTWKRKTEDQEERLRKKKAIWQRAAQATASIPSQEVCWGPFPDPITGRDQQDAHAQCLLLRVILDCDPY